MAEQTSPAADVIAGNDDLLTSIIIRLPPKSLIKFKSVSKHWLSLISSPNFSHRHTRRNPSSAVSGIFLRKSQITGEFEFVSLHPNISVPPFTSLNFVNDPSGLKLLQSCNGLLLCSSFRRIGTLQNYYIYNPTTNQFSTLTLSPGKAVFGVNLAFDPYVSPHYNVVCVRSSALSIYLHQFEIYSSESGSWRLSGDPFTAPFDMVFNDGVFWNGAVHWMSPTGASMYLDIDRGRLGTMPVVPINVGWGKRRFRYFGESCGHLHLIEIYGPRTTQFDIFEMERDYSRWFVKYRVDLDALITAFPETVRNYHDPSDFHYYAFFVLCLVREKNEDESLLVLHIPGKVISYNFKDKTFEKLRDLMPGRNNIEGSLQFGWLDAYLFVETLDCV